MEGLGCKICLYDLFLVQRVRRAGGKGKGEVLKGGREGRIRHQYREVPREPQDISLCMDTRRSRDNHQ